eukprot:6470155-Amphidinium_carterae.1
MPKTYGDTRHGQSAGKFGYCTFLQQSFGLSGESKRSPSLRMASSIMYTKLGTTALRPYTSQTKMKSIPRLTFGPQSKHQSYLGIYDILLYILSAKTVCEQGIRPH